MKRQNLLESLPGKKVNIVHSILWYSELYEKKEFVMLKNLE